MTRVRQTVGVSARVLLGGFVLWQGVYLFGALFTNADEAFGSPLRGNWAGVRAFTPNGEPPSGGVLAVIDEIDRGGFHRYGEMTGQRQNWSLFAPDVADRFNFP